MSHALAGGIQMNLFKLYMDITDVYFNSIAFRRTHSDTSRSLFSLSVQIEVSF